LFDHISDAYAQPALVRLRPGLYGLRFESMKVASALGAVRQLMADGVIEPGDTLVDSSSGVYAYALALACRRYGFSCHIVASPIVDPTLKAQLRILGATVDQPSQTDDPSQDQAGRVERVREYVKNNERAHWMRQYHDRVHYHGYTIAARQITDGLAADRITLVGGVGSGASTGGLSTALRQSGVDVEVGGVQPFGSVSFGSQDVADPEFLIAGLGSGIFFGNIDYSAYRTIHWLDFTYARSGSVELLRDHCVFAGLSSGASYVVADWHATRLGDDDRNPVVFVIPDTGHRYVRAVYNESPVVARDRSPLVIEGPESLRLPWCLTDWEQNGHRFSRPETDPS
jgi:cysteine synthase A